MTELRAAAERLLNCPAHWTYVKRDADVALCAAAYLAEHRADDDEPITEDWFKSTGFVGVSHYRKCLRFPSHDDVFVFVLKDGVQPFVEGAGSRIDRFAKCQTRRDIRRLASALGIQLTEAP